MSKFLKLLKTLVECLISIVFIFIFRYVVSGIIFFLGIIVEAIDMWKPLFNGKNAEVTAASTLIIFVLFVLGFLLGNYILSKLFRALNKPKK